MSGKFGRVGVRFGMARLARKANQREVSKLGDVKHVWAEGSRMTGDVEVAAKVCDELEAKGTFSAEALVDASRDKDAPLHDMFEWNDTVAAEKYRIEQAKKIIRSIVVVMEDKPMTYRAYSSTGQKVYVSTAKALSETRTREIILSTAKAELMAFKRKYQTLTELSEVFEVIDRVV